MRSGKGRSWLLGMFAVAGWLMLTVVAAAPASAHATLLFAVPVVGGAVPQSPHEVTLIFDERVTLSGAPIVLTDTTRRQVRVGQGRTEQDGRVVVVPVSQRLTPGVYDVRWQIVANDGDPVGGAYRFVVGPATSLTTMDILGPAGPSQQSPALVPSTVLRWLLFGALSVSLGGLVGVRVVRPLAGPLPVPAPWTGPAASVGAAAAAGLAGLVSGAGSLWRAVTGPSLSALWSQPGRLALLEVAGFGAAATLAGTRARRWAWVPLLLVVVAEALRAHPAVALPGWGALLTGLHLLAAATWVGALGQVVRTALAWRSAAGRRAWSAVAAYARLAAWLFGAVVLTGILSALVILPWEAWTSTGYGRLLLLKVGLVAVAAGLAVLGRGRLHAHRTNPASRPPGASLRIEHWLLVLVLGVTALLVSLPPPTAVGQEDLALAPPPSGLVVPLGARAGAIGVSAAASAGQLVVYLSAPTFANRAQGADATLYRLRGTATTSGNDAPLAWRRCGPGCFAAPLAWGTGQNLVSLHTEADGWAGGDVSFVVPWPARPGTTQLRTVTAAMARVPQVLVYEQVSSNSQDGPGQVTRLVMSGQEFLDAEPYGSGRAGQAALLPADKGQSVLAVGFPGDLTQAELAYDRRGRLLRETLTAPHHWITRTFVYPEK